MKIIGNVANFIPENQCKQIKLIQLKESLKI